MFSYTLKNLVGGIIIGVSVSVRQSIGQSLPFLSALLLSKLLTITNGPISTKLYRIFLSKQAYAHHIFQCGMLARSFWRVFLAFSDSSSFGNCMNC